MKTLLMIVLLCAGCYAWQPFCDSCTPRPYYIESYEEGDTNWSGDQAAYTEWVSYVKKYHSINAKYILKFKLRIGYTKNELLLAAGTPDKIRTISNTDGNGDVYYYDNFLAVVLNNKVTLLQRR
jgi:hypothetical protein